MLIDRYNGNILLLFKFTHMHLGELFMDASNVSGRNYTSQYVCYLSVLQMLDIYNIYKTSIIHRLHIQYKYT